MIAAPPFLDALQTKLDALINGSPIKFDPESIELSDTARSTIKQVAETAHCPPEAKLQITVSARYEDAEKAKQISQQRADAVAKELVADGFAAERIAATGIGNADTGADAATVRIKVA